MTFSSPGGDVFSTYAFWDGGTGSTSDKARFTFRFAFPKSSTNPTVWNWSTTCETPSFCGSGTATPSLTTSGTVSVSNYSGTNALYLWGFWSAITLGWELPGGTTRYWSSLRTEANTPVVWIGDTAWAAPMKATDSDWHTYINDRKESTGSNLKARR
ncbi:MAG: DUF4038 domain-containing protein [Thermoanaerobaculia bacterium]